jgi:DNA-binding response OmpR family regulator
MRILFVDNHPEFTLLVTQTFLATHEVVIVPTILAALAAVQGSLFDIALVDYDLDDGKGVEFVRWVRASRTPLRMVAVSARVEGNQVLVSAGADAICAKMDFAGIQR